MYALMFLWLIFYDFLESNIPLVNYWDELAMLLVLCWGACSFRKDLRLQKDEWIDWGCLVLLVVIGALGNLLHPGLQEAKVALVKDVVALCKFPIIFFVLSRRKVTQAKQEKIIADIAKVSRVIVVITLFAAVIGRFVDLDFYDAIHRTKPAFKFLFSHQTFFVSSFVMIAAALIAESLERNRLYLVLICVLQFLTLRTKAYIFIAFLVPVILLGEVRVTKLLTVLFGTGKEKVKLGRLFLAAAVLLLMIFIVGKQRLMETIYRGLQVPRTALHVIGLKILVDFFPFGSGLGTFASYLSGRYYSNIYDLYGISNVVGMNREEYHFISDVFWPYIYGQFGIFGMLIYGKLIFSIFIRQFRASIADGSRLAVTVVWIYALIASTSEAYFTNGTGVQMALFLGLLIGYGDQKAVTDGK